MNFKLGLFGVLFLFILSCGSKYKDIEEYHLTYCQKDKDCVVVPAINGYQLIPERQADCKGFCYAAINFRFQKYWANLTRKYQRPACLFNRQACKPKANFTARCIAPGKCRLAD